MVSIEQAAANALAVYLRTKLGTGVKVSNRWPSPDRALPPLAVTILLSGEPTRNFIQPIAESSVAGSSAGKLLYRWHILETAQPLQVDCWATQDVARDDLKARVDAALLGGNQADTYPIPGNLVLTLATGDGWTGYAAFHFDSGFTDMDTPDAAKQAEFRAVGQGEARVALYIDAETPRLARIILKQILGGGSRPDDVVS